METLTDFPKKDIQESIPDQSKGETKGGVTGDPGTEHSGSKPDIPSEDDLTEDEKKMLSDTRRFPCYLSRLRMNSTDPKYLEKHPKLSASFRKVLAVIDST